MKKSVKTLGRMELFMNWMSKLERRFGKYAIHNLMFYIMILYGVGFVLMNVNPLFYIRYLSLDASQIFKGQVWRLVTFLIYPPDTDILYFIISMFLYYSLGTTLERVWGAFRFNLYFFTGVLGHILAALLIYLIFGQVFLLGTAYLNWSLFFAFAATFPDMQFLLFFIIPVKAKWLGYVAGAEILYSFFAGGFTTKIEIAVSLLNFIVFFLMTRNYRAVNPVEIARKIMEDPYIYMHGPEHHVMVGAVLLTAYRNSGGDIDLKEALEEMKERGSQIPGGVCGFWGCCGAGVSTGIYMSIVTGATPLAGRSWGLANRTTAKALEAIGELGGPRCCKRDTFTAIRKAAEMTAQELGVEMDCPAEIVCTF